MSKFDTFPAGKKRKETVKKNQEEIAKFKITGKERIERSNHYTWVDSPVDGDFYPNYSKGGEPFINSFRGVLPESGIVRYIETALKERKGKAIGIEFGGIGSSAFAGFPSNFFAKSIGVTLVDHREPYDLPVLLEKDRKIHHEVLVGDIFDPKTYESLNQKLNGEKVDFIVSRMARGLEFVPIEPYTVSKILKIWYELLRTEGIMLVQTPVEFNKLLSVWLSKIQVEFKDIIEIQYKLGNQNRNTHCSAFRLRKLFGAPSELPLLEPRAVRSTSKF